MINTKKRAFGFGALIQTIRNYLLRKYYYFKYDIFHPIFNSRVRKYNKLQKICNSLMENHKWVDGIDHDYFAYPETRSYESEVFGESANVITIADDHYDYGYDGCESREDFEKDFLALIAKHKLSDCVYKRFLYQRFNHDEVTYVYE